VVEAKLRSALPPSNGKGDAKEAKAA